MADIKTYISVQITRNGSKWMALNLSQYTSHVPLSRDEARDLGKALICMADLADELDNNPLPQKDTPND